MERFKPIPTLSEIQLCHFWALIEKRGPTECWLWKGGVTEGIRGGDPYGLWVINIDGERHNLRPHRVSYTLLVGPIPDGLTLDHVKPICTNTLCCNPAHTEPVTQSVNSMRRTGATATVCANGHAREAGKKCATCRRECNRRYNLKKGRIKNLELRRNRAAHHTPPHPLDPRVAL